MAKVTHKVLNPAGRVVRTTTGQSRPIRPERLALARAQIIGEAMRVSAVVTCHNYARYLAQCLASLREQTVPFAEIFVVDDASDDDPAAVVRKFTGVQYLRECFRDVCAARNAGMERTNWPLIVNVDADNWLGHRWLETLLPHMQDLDLGLVFAPPMQTRKDGTSWRPAPWARPFDYHALRRENFIDTCCLARKEAIQQAGGWRPGLQNALTDWHLWLRVTRGGWQVKCLPDQTPWFYRVHDERMSVGYKEQVCEKRLEIARDVFHVAVVTPFCGREWALQRYAKTLGRLGWDPARLHWIGLDNSCDARFGKKLWDLARRQCADWASATIIHDETPAVRGLDNNHFADERQLRQQHLGRLADAMSRLYARLAQRLLGEGIDLVLTLEDDIEPLGEDLIPRLAAHLAPDVLAVSGVVRSRFVSYDDHGPGVIAFDLGQERPYSHLRVTDHQKGVQAVAGSSLGCLLTRAEAWHRYLPRRTSVNGDGICLWHDLAWSANVRRAGFRWLLDWSVETRHWQKDGSYV